MATDYNELNNDLQVLADQQELREIEDELKELEQRWIDQETYCIYAEHDARYQAGGYDAS